MYWLHHICFGWCFAKFFFSLLYNSQREHKYKLERKLRGPYDIHINISRQFCTWFSMAWMRNVCETEVKRSKMLHSTIWCSYKTVTNCDFVFFSPFEWKEKLFFHFQFCSRIPLMVLIIYNLDHINFHPCILQKSRNANVGLTFHGTDTHIRMHIIVFIYELMGTWNIFMKRKQIVSTTLLINIDKSMDK